MTEKEKGFLMAAGVLAPAFMATSIHIAYHKRATLTMSDLLVFSITAIVFGFVTSKIINNK